MFYYIFYEALFRNYASQFPLLKALNVFKYVTFRTAYAAVNVPYLAMTARVSADSGDRAFVAGIRMLFGTAAAVVIALSTVSVGRWLTGSTASQAYFAAAALFAAIVGVKALESECP